MLKNVQVSPNSGLRTKRQPKRKLITAG